MQPVKMGIIGPGNIARRVASAMQQLPQVSCHAVASRDLPRAQRFAREYAFGKAYGSYQELVLDPDVELVYIATPHSHHAAHAKLCLQHGKAVLCEKPFAANAKQAQEVFELAHKNKVFITEAMWTRYLPLSATLRKLVDDGIVGQISVLSANLGHALFQVPRLTQPQLAGGALLDLGIYPLHFAAMMFGLDLQQVTSSAILTPTGVDAQNSITLIYKNKRMASLYSTFMAVTDQRAVLGGEEGFVVVDGITNPAGIQVFNKEGQLTQQFDRLGQINGYEYEILASAKALRQGKLACSELPHAETLQIIKIMDDLRAKWGVQFPFEQ